MVEGQTWPPRAAARLAIFEWIAIRYNRRRRHSALDSPSPVARETVLLSRRAAWRHIPHLSEVRPRTRRPAISEDESLAALLEALA
jgi:hypothetical protein